MENKYRATLSCGTQLDFVENDDQDAIAFAREMAREYSTNLKFLIVYRGDDHFNPVYLVV